MNHLLPSANFPRLPHGFRHASRAVAEQAWSQLWYGGVEAGRIEGVVVGAVGGLALAVLIGFLLRLHARREGRS